MHKTSEGVNYFVPESGDKESVWDLPEGATLICTKETTKPNGTSNRYTMHKTSEGVNYFVPESGDKESVWDLPEGATLI